MPIPEHVAWLRDHVGPAPLWLTGMTAVVLKHDPDAVADPDGPAAPPSVLVVRRSDNGAYTPVSGIVDPGEHPADTAVREAEEETCVRIEVERLIDVRVVGPITYPNGDVSTYLDHAFVCRWVSGEPRVGDDESTEAGWWPADALPPLSDAHAALVQAAVTGEVGPYLGPPEAREA
ncbi:NUDIX hydrolase [Mobilicoccus caccae]|uniref:MutT/NUDIX-family protein n=1 Tax=Mobilicoccus caccae TaxID=1859295 RepID=A0ABQ6IP22_9MICO|nr:NUDIX domain-containing protein [Mobilicoccus caccae]GMA38474.1 putative MutT/NUDIX-family protein [Mobilicoccus caccae]